MKVVVDVSPLATGHRYRGIGAYTQNLVKALQSIKLENFSVQLIKQGEIPKDCDVIHYPYFDFFFLTLPISKPKPTVVTIHDVIPLVFPQHYPPGIRGKTKFQIQKLSLKGTKAVITDSENSKKDIVKHLGFPAKRIHVVHLAPGDEFSPLPGSMVRTIRPKYKLPKRFILYVGDVNYNKNIKGLIKAFRQLTISTSEEPKLTSEVKLVLVGKAFMDEELKETKQIVQLIKSLGLNDKIIRLGWIPQKDLVGIYNLATVYCQPSFYEGFGLPVLEAMSCGCPVVAAKTSSLREICGDAALMVDPYDINDIARGLEMVIDDKKISDMLGKKGLRWVKNFSWERTAKETIEVYKKVLNAQ
jgi:glycosyltransferase involved in cell wall biosynthesis